MVAITAAVFSPILHFDFVNLDVGNHLLDNPHIREVSWKNLRAILTRPCVTSYYPVRTLTYLVDYQIWGLGPKGYKLTNGLIHLTNIVLVYALLLRMMRYSERTDESLRGDVAASALGTIVFALHPVVVEPVAWVPGREELLMTLGALACFHFHLIADARAVQNESGRVWPMRLAAALACGAACLSNAVGAVIPMIAAVWDVLMLRRPTWKRIAIGTWPLWAIGLATVSIKVWSDSQNVYADQASLPVWRNVLIVPKTLWLNLKTVAWPTGLTVDHWDDIPSSAADEQVLMGLIALVVLSVVLWSLRRQRILMFGAAWFGLALGPSSQIMPHHIMRADRFLYLPLVGIAILLALGARRILPRWRRSRRVLSTGVAVSLTLLLMGLTSRQLQTWRNSVSLWEQCVRVCPTNGVGYAYLADALAEQGRFDEAKPIFEHALELDPDNPHTMAFYAYRLSMCRQEESRDYDRAIRLGNRACEMVRWQVPEYRYILSAAQMNQATAFGRAGDFGRAIDGYRAAIKAAPDYRAPVLNLALLLVRCEDARQRDPEEAVRLAEHAADRQSPLHLSLLAEVYAGAGRSGEAQATLAEAMRLARNAEDSEMFEALSAQLHQHKGAPLDDDI